MILYIYFDFIWNSTIMTTTNTIHPAIFDFLKQIKEHNSREFFAFVKPLYEQIQENLTDRCISCMTELHRKLDINFWETKAKDCLFRIYRDARRIKEWDLIYKENFGMVLWPNGKHDSRANWFYLHIQDGKSFFGWWIYRPEPADLARIRNFLSKNGDKYYQIIENPKFKERFWQIWWDSLVKLPRWFDENTKYPELIKRKQFLISRNYTNEEILSDDFMDIFISDCRLAKPFFELLNQWCEYWL